MKINKKQLVEQLSAEILKSVSFSIREIVREELDLAKNSLRRQILNEMKLLKLKKNGHSVAPRESQDDPGLIETPVRNKTYTGFSEIDSIMNSLSDTEFKSTAGPSDFLSFSQMEEPKTKQSLIKEVTQKRKENVQNIEPVPGQYEEILDRMEESAKAFKTNPLGAETSMATAGILDTRSLYDKKELDKSIIKEPIRGINR